MQYDVDRLSVLAGISDVAADEAIHEEFDQTSESDASSVLSEGADSAKGEESRIDENALRNFIRREVKTMLQGMSEAGVGPDSEKSESSWIYGSEGRPKMSRGGRVTLGLLGVGFK